MKKIIASAVIAAATLSASQAAVFNGASAGLTLGTLTSKYKAKHTDGEKVNLNKTFGAYGIHFDYDRSSCNSFYWGLGVDFLFNSGKVNKKSRMYTNLGYSYKQSWSSEFDVRLGYNFGNTVAAYGLAGLQLAKTERKAFNTQTKATLYKKSKTQFVPVLGLGAKVKVSDKVSVGAEYRYTFENSEKGTVLGVKFKDKVSSHAALAKVSYHF